jgi:sulfatase modifying factor 1
MQILTIALAALLGSAFAPAPSTITGVEKHAPPGMVIIPGGRTKVGSSVKDITKLFEEHSEARDKARGFMGEIPEHSVTVDDFFLSVSEITNEQYREFIKAAGFRPPFLWAEEAINAERARFLKAEGEKRRKAKDEGLPAPERRAFEQADAEFWWDSNWKGQPWEMPEKLAKRPVVYVDHTDVLRYAEWAGLRLPTENEFERAVRGGGSNIYPWGSEWKRNMACTKEATKISAIMDVGSFPDGANGQGIMDLVGNVWEWTASPYTEYPGWKHTKIKIGKGKAQRVIDAMPSWSADKRVVKSGGQSTAYIFARGPIRGGFPRHMRNNALGFRCAASQKAGLDFASERLRGIPNQIRPFDSKGPITYNPNAVIAMDRWSSATGSSTIPGYGLVTGYDYVLFTPAEAMDTNGVTDIRKASGLDVLFHVGFIATNKDLIEPALPAGTYLVAIRGAGKIPERTDGTEGGDENVEIQLASTMRVDEHLEFDESKDNYIFINMEGSPVATMVAEDLNYGNPKAGSTNIGVVNRSVLIQGTDADGKDTREQVDQQWVQVNYFVKGKSRKGLTASLGLRFTPGAMDGDWRR